MIPAYSENKDDKIQKRSLCFGVFEGKKYYTYIYGKVTYYKTRYRYLYKSVSLLKIG